ncbi:MAG: hypothetical protein AAF409_14005 [Pseudomonadota bacterium]
MFEPNPKARADLKPGTLYAVVGENGWIYYGQIDPDKSVAFVRRRDRSVAEASEILSSDLMSVVTVFYPSIGEALRSGAWEKIGRYPIGEKLGTRPRRVQWPVGTITVTVWDHRGTSFGTTVQDPEIQHLEVMSAWDASHHIKERLTADFGVEDPAWHVGGPVWRERKVKEEYARRFPEISSHSLPADWVFTG